MTFASELNLRPPPLIASTDEIRRNRHLHWSRSSNELFLCKYLKLELPPPIVTPPHLGPPGLSPHILDHIRRAFLWQQPPTRKPAITFKASESAAEKNFSLLQDCGMDFSRFLWTHGGTPCGLGSEFKPVHLLAQIFGRHPLCSRACCTLLTGVDPDYFPLSEPDRLSDLQEALARGNHQSASQKPHVLAKLMANDIKYGYAVPLPRARALEIPGLVLLPAGIAVHDTISDNGEIVPKDRLTHDQSFHYGSEKSWNSRIGRDTLTHLRYGKALSRLIHYIVDFRHHHPDTALYISKSDYKAAYRRLHQAHHHAIQCGLILDENVILILLRMSFGGAPNPNFWSDISEMACDLVNELLCSRDWSPEEFIPYLPCDMPEPELAPPDAPPLQQAVRPSVRIEMNEFGICDVFIDDKILIIPDMYDNLERARYVLAIVIALLERPVAPKEYVLRDCLLSLNKFNKEGCLKERQVVLGWELDTRLLRVRLPEEKFIAWSDSIRTIIDSGSATLAQLETLNGRLTHLGSMNPAVRHFNGDIRFVIRITDKRERWRRNNPITLSNHLISQNLPLWLNILSKARDGFPMNNLVYRDPTRIHSADASMFGIGVVNFTNGKAYRWELPDHLKFRVHINILEFAASILALLLDDEIAPMDCVLAKTDNTSAEGWLGKSNFASEDRPIHTSLAHLLGHDLMDRGYCLYSQHWPGTDNVVCDSLSRDFHLDDDSLTTFLHSACPDQLPPNFRICCLPSAVSSRIYSLLPIPTDTTPSSQEPTRSELWRGRDGSSSVTIPVSQPMSTSTESAHMNESYSSEPSPSESDKDTSQPDSNRVIPHLWPTPPGSMSSNWQRPSGMLSGGIHDSIATVNQAAFYLDSGEATEIKIALRDLKRPSPERSSDGCGPLPAPLRRKL